MHRSTAVGARKNAAMHIADRKLRHDSSLHQPSLGCAGCAERKLCGCLAVEADVWSCLSFCCNDPDGCDRVCRNNPDYAFRVQEIGGFELKLPPAPLLPTPTLPLVVPEVFHGSRRSRHFAPALASVSLYGMFDRMAISVLSTPRRSPRGLACRRTMSLK
jgi:hypothetical protein